MRDVVTPPGPNAPTPARVVVKMFPDLREVYESHLSKTGDPLKAFVEVQVQFIMALDPSLERTRVEEVYFNDLAFLRSAYPRGLREYCLGAVNGIRQALTQIFEVMARDGLMPVANVVTAKPNA